MTPPEPTKCNYESDQHGSSRLFRTVSRRAPGGNDPRSEPRALFILWIGVDRQASPVHSYRFPGRDGGVGGGTIRRNVDET